ncbi:HD domain-containing protein [Nocardia puris]|uniref:HD domain-containing protein n=1 Tax=Nocardia puris TaxID=208602 RepID=UPI001895C640|nr:HD domain-containing protein [Nocardia puris]MBF6212252.1 HD domain-containing protein [Nocardia puris]MBF6366499.1 HD domain-containing protein [Nocardia puris]MBF6460841.1 HD domain-containing protein [Nocardia puris]
MDAAIEGLLIPLTESRRAHTIEVGRKVERVAHLVPEEIRAEVVSAAYLHDVGYGYPVSGFHPLDGAELLEARGYSPIVCHLVAFHSASTVEAEVRGIDAKSFDRYALAPVPGIAMANDLVWWADMTTGPTGSTLTLGERLADIRVRYPSGTLVRTAIDRAEPLLRGAVQRASGSM